MRPDIHQFVEDLNLGLEGKFSNGTYTFDLIDSETFSDVYNTISTDPKYRLEHESTSDRDNAKFTFYTDWFELEFSADFEKDNYKLYISER